ncbi:MAG TPA: hypothetical protein VKA51_12260 [Rubrobacteraceae bacterium]|nr:hypothetical protein [Rubrobacteraceae bacterium]
MADTNLFGAARVFGFGLAVAAALSIVLLVPKPAHAAGFAVNSTGDAGTRPLTARATRTRGRR